MKKTPFLIKPMIKLGVVLLEPSSDKTTPTSAFLLILLAAPRLAVMYSISSSSGVLKLQFVAVTSCFYHD